MISARISRLARAVVSLVIAASAAGPLTGQTPEPRRVTLEEAIDIALQRNPDLQTAEAQVDAAESRRLGAYGAFLPSITTGYGFSESSTGRLDPTGQSITTTSYALQLVGRYTVFSGLRRFGQLQTARLDVRAQDAAYRERRFATVLEVTGAFLNAVAARELVRVEEDRLGRQLDQLDMVQRQLELGLVARSDLLRARVDLNNARVALVNAESSLRAAGFELARAMGVDWIVEPDPEATLESDSLTHSRTEILAAALESAPAVLSARAAADAAGAAVGTARSAYLPQLDVIGRFDWQAPDFPPRQRSWAVIVQGSLPIFNGFQRERELQTAGAEARQARARAHAADLALRADINAAYDRFETAAANIELGVETVELAREDLAATRERYRLGRATTLDLRSAEIGLRQAEVDLVRSRFDRRLAIAELESLLGRELSREAILEM